jgi:D-alanyl-lipoteichoic acid acyltransferase DltB (MBOAT superfamily)
MSLTSGKYLLFLAAVFFAYWLLSRWRKAQVVLVLAVSYYFYALWNWNALALIVALSTVDFLTAHEIGRTDNKRLKKAMLWLSVCTDIGALFAFKYFNFFSASLTELLNKFGLHTSHQVLHHFVLPIGLSFLTFRSLSYVIDVYRGTMKPTNRYLDYLAFVAFFPTLIAGPVVRAKDLLPQFVEKARLTSEEGTHAIFLIMLGFVKKLLIADYLAHTWVERVFDTPALYSTTETLVAVYGYALQIYCDFSGYSDIAIGSAMLLGFRLPENFNSPYRALSLPDFWRRWHITLSNWLTDYVYFSIGGLRKRPFNLYRNLILTMLIGGLWHGAAWSFVLWGGLHGAGLSVNRWWENRRRRLKQKPRAEWWIKALCIFATFHFVCFTWLFFRAGSLTQAGQILSRFKALEFSAPNLTWQVVTMILIGFAAHWFPRNALEKLRDGWTWLPAPVQAAFILALAVGLSRWSSAEVQFIYGNF